MHIQQKQYKYVILPNGEKIHYRIQNEVSQSTDPAIVLVHGNFSSLGWWDEAIDVLKTQTQRKIVAYDQRGFGKSSYINKCNRFGNWAQDAVQLFKLLKLQKIILIGWSFGGAVCQKIAQLIPNTVAKLILTSSVAHDGLVLTNSEGHPCKSTEQIVAIPRIAAAIGMLNSNNKQAMRNVFDLLLFKKCNHVSESRKAQLSSDPFSQRCYPELLTALANSDIDIDKIKAQTLVIHGTDDMVIPVQSILATGSKLGKVDLWQDHCHMVPIQDTAKYVETIKKFI